MIALTILFEPSLFKYAGVDIRTATTVPFFKNLVFEFGPILYVLFVIFIITATSNAVNLTDGLDGLSAGTVAIAFIPIGAIAYFSGNLQLSDYLNIPYLRGAGELTVFCSALVGAVLGFLLVQRAPGASHYGRYRLARARRRNGNANGAMQERTRTAYCWWNLFPGIYLGNFTNRVFQVFTKTIWRGPPNFQNGSYSSSLSTTRMEGIEDRHARIYCGDHSCHSRTDYF